MKVSVDQFDFVVHAVESLDGPDNPGALRVDLQVTALADTSFSDSVLQFTYQGEAMLGESSSVPADSGPELPDFLEMRSGQTVRGWVVWKGAPDIPGPDMLAYRTSEEDGDTTYTLIVALD